MEIGIFHAIDGILRIYANFAAGWIGALTADLVINKPLGLSSTATSSSAAPTSTTSIRSASAHCCCRSLPRASPILACSAPLAQILSPFVGAADGVRRRAADRLGDARALLPGARRHDGPAAATCDSCAARSARTCSSAATWRSARPIRGPICSLCCTLESRCHDACKPHGRFAEQLAGFLRRVLPARAAAALNTRAGHFVGILLLCNLATGLLLSLIYHQYSGSRRRRAPRSTTTLWLVFLCLLLLSGVGAWLIVLAHESRRAAEAESARQTAMLMEEIEAHRRTDAALQRAKEVGRSAPTSPRHATSWASATRSARRSTPSSATRSCSSAAAPARPTTRCASSAAAPSISRTSSTGCWISREIENGMLRLNRDKVRLPEFLDQLVDMFRAAGCRQGPGVPLPARPANLPRTGAHRSEAPAADPDQPAVQRHQVHRAAARSRLTVRYRSEIAEFEVADTGRGIAPADLERIFEPFERGSGQAVRSVPGTGLGLTITKLLTQIMGGEVLVQRSSAAGAPVRGAAAALARSRSEVAERRDADRNGSATTVGPRRRSCWPTTIRCTSSCCRTCCGRSASPCSCARDGKTCLQLAAAVPSASWRCWIFRCRTCPAGSWRRTLRATGRGSSRLKIMIVSANAHEYCAEPVPAHDAFVMKPIELAAAARARRHAAAAQLDPRAAAQPARARPRARAAAAPTWRVPARRSRRPPTMRYRWPRARPLAPSPRRSLSARPHRPRARHRGQAARARAGGSGQRGGRRAAARAGQQLRSETLHERAGGAACRHLRPAHCGATPCWSWTTRPRR